MSFKKGTYKQTEEHKRKIGLANKGKIRTEVHKLNISDGTKKAMTESGIGKHISKVLKDKYKNGFISPTQGIKRPDLSKMNKLNPRLGKDNPSWIDGRSYDGYPLEFKRISKSKVLQNQYNFTCQLCIDYIPKSTIWDRKKLTLHHIDYNKNNNLLTNLIPLCNT